MTDGVAIVGRVRKPHGIHGELVVETMCDEPAAVFASGRSIFVGDTSGVMNERTRTTATVVRSRPFKEGILLTLEGIKDRNDAELWRNKPLAVPTSDLRPPTEGEVWISELAGMTVTHVSGAHVGEVVNVQTVPQGLLLDVKTERGIVSVPFVDAIVVGVDREGRTITIDPPEGLMEL